MYKPFITKHNIDIHVHIIYVHTYSRTCIIGVRAPPPHDPPKPTFLYKVFLILFNIKEGPQSISIAKVDFEAIFKMAASENGIYFICSFFHHIEAKLVSKQTFPRSRNTMGTLFGQ